MGKPNLLYISPAVPAVTGNGLAMRAAMVLEALAADYAVHLLIIPVLAQACDEISPDVSAWCARSAIHRSGTRPDPLFSLIARIEDPRERLAARLSYPKPALCRFTTSSAVLEAAQVFGSTVFHEVHVFRLYMAPFAEPYLRAGPEQRPTCRLDMDDHESVTRHRLAELFEANGAVEAAALERSEAQNYADMEQEYLPRFDRVYVCSHRDRLEITGRHGGSHVTVVPNGVRIPPAPASPRRQGPFTLLFVGSLGYYPNEDAALFLCTEVLPRLRALTAMPVQVYIVGTHPSERLRQLSAVPGVTVTGSVPNLARYYQSADLVVVPIRAGGGTRIKLLEAFAHRRPVVSTTLGAEGIEARHGTHVLLADTPRDFAGQCARLVETPSLGVELAQRAFELVSTAHSPERIQELLRRDHRPVGP